MHHPAEELFALAQSVQDPVPLLAAHMALRFGVMKQGEEYALPAVPTPEQRHGEVL